MSGLRLSAAKIAWLALLLLVGGVSLRRALDMEFDFHHFYRDAEYAWTHGGQLNPVLVAPDAARQRQLPFYLPAVTILLAPLAAGGPTSAAILWAAGQVACLGWALRILRRWASAGEVSQANPVLIAALLSLPMIFEAAKFNQLSFLILALVLAGADRVIGGAHEMGESKRAGVSAQLVGGALLGFAAFVKLLPVLLLIWLLLKRRWTAASGFVLCATASALLPCLIVLGPDGTRAAHREWWDYNVRGAAAAALVRPELREHFLDHRNQAIGAVVARLCWADHPYRVAWQPLNLPLELCTRIGQALAALLLAALAIAMRQPAARLSVQRLRAEAAAMLVAMIVLSPLLRTYYYVWALPALAMITLMAVGSAAPRVRRLGAVGLVVWIVGLIAWMSPAARLAGANLLVLTIFGGILIVASRAASPLWNATAGGPSRAARPPAPSDPASPAHTH